LEPDLESGGLRQRDDLVELDEEPAVDAVRCEADAADVEPEHFCEPEDRHRDLDVEAAGDEDDPYPAGRLGVLASDAGEVLGEVVARGGGASTAPGVASRHRREPDTRSAIVTLEQPRTTSPVRRRPSWRGERQALLIRLPITSATAIRDRTNTQGRSLSDVAGDLLAEALAGPSTTNPATRR